VFMVSAPRVITGLMPTAFTILPDARLPGSAATR
jgi:hypothetical protein